MYSGNWKGVYVNPLAKSTAVCKIEMSGYDWYDWLVVKCSKEPEILDISMVGETWMKRCKKQKSHTWCILFLTLAVNLIRKILQQTKPLHFVDES